ncbi:alanyl-tRNA ligase, partial [Lacticaseibacillus paracasei subsp. paracasei Lpp123]
NQAGLKRAIDQGHCTKTLAAVAVVGPDMAQAGGKNPAGIPAALSEAKTVISQKA